MLVFDLEKKLASSVKIANDFKKVIEKQELTIEELLEKVKIGEAQKFEFTGRLEAINEGARNEVDSCNSRIQDLERQIYVLKEENHLHKDHNERFARQISDLKADLRRNQFETTVNYKTKNSRNSSSFRCFSSP